MGRDKKRVHAKGFHSLFQWSSLFASYTNKTNAQTTEVCISQFSLGEAEVTMNPKLSVHDNKLLFLIQLGWVYYDSAQHSRMQAEKLLATCHICF